MVSQSWKDHAYPLKQLVVKVQCQRHHTREDLIRLLETALKHVKIGGEFGTEHDDDYGFEFRITESEESFFGDEPASALTVR